MMKMMMIVMMMTPAVEMHMTMLAVEFSVSCQCMLAHRARVEAHLVDTWQE